MNFSVATYIIDVFTVARNAIIKYQSFKELTGDQKKDRVDAYVKEMLRQSLESKKCPYLFKLVIKYYLLKNVSTITQKIYDLIKDNVEGITNK